MSTNRKSVALVSGGQDSCTVAAFAANESDLQALVNIDYGQRHLVERDSADYWAKKLGVPIKHVKVAALADLGDSALIGRDTGSVNEPHPRLAHLPGSFVPGRNLLFVTIAAAYAMKIGADMLYAGMNQTDYSGYPDCRGETLDALQTAIRLGMDWPEFRLELPLLNLTKAQTFLLAADLGVLSDVIDNTHTCYEGDHTTLHEWGFGCGSCPACQIRANGYKEYMEQLA